MGGSINPSVDTLESIKKYNYNPSDEGLKLTSIIILTYNQLAYTKLCIESIRKFTPKNSYEIIVVDNNSSDETVEWLKKQKDITGIYNKENKGFPGGCNQGIKIARGDNILLLNNDTIVTPNWLNNMQKALYSDDNIGIVGTITNECSNYQQIEVDYHDFESMIEFSKKINISNELAWDQRVKLVGYCFMIRKELIDKIGLLDEGFFPGNYEDDDYSIRSICAGYKNILCKDVFIHHFRSVSFNSLPETFSQSMVNNLTRFNEKWGFNIHYSSFVRFELIELIKKPLDAPLKVLEVGCSLGLTLLEIKNKFRNAEIYGIEIDENVAKITKNLFPFICGNIETLDLPYDENYFDIILFPDVLEHLVDPWETLRKMKKYLKKDGNIISSIPNIMYIQNLVDLIRGNFNYVDAGILDKTHLRFFTLAEIQKLFDSTGYNLDLINAIAHYPSPENEKIIDLLCTISNENIKQQYTIYQYLVCVSNKENLSQISPPPIDEKLEFKFKLMRIDNDLDIEDSLNYILKLFLNNKDTFLDDLKSLVDECVIEKDKVMKLICDAALSNNMLDLYNILK